MTKLLLVSGMLLVLGSALGCAGPDAERSVPDTPVWPSGQEWRLSDEPLFTIGAVDGDEALGRVATIGRESGVALLSGGRIAVADIQANYIRIYDGAGDRLTTTGRRGDGPGEFSGLQDIYAFADGDSLLAWDSRKRLSILSADGAFARTVPAQKLESASSLGILRVVGVANNGTSLIHGYSWRTGWKRPSSGTYRPPEPYWLASAAGDSVASFGPLLGGEFMVDPTLPGGIGFITFGLKSEVALGKRFIYSGESDSFEIAVSLPGASEPDRYLRRPYAPIPVPYEVLGARRAAIRADRIYPVFNRILEDPDEDVWIRHGAPAADTIQTWSVFDPEGVWLGEVRFPAAMSVRAVGRDVIAVVVRDDFDVEYVQVFQIVKAH